MDGLHRSNPQVTPMPTAAAAAAEPVASAEEEAIKKNTDCVYFLASPLTCKKGSECEYRHSDSARLNPRDCWYWLNGNCLNPKCAFRHPPLDALVGPEVLNHAETFMPPAHAMATAAQVPYVSNKHGVPCIFFQQGICMKGDRCSFFHAQTSLSNKAPQKQGALPTTTEAAPKKTFGVLEKCTQLKNNPQINALKSGGIPTAAKPVVKEGLPLAKNSFLADKNTTPSSVNDDERSKYKPTSVPAANGNPVSGTSQMQTGFDDHDDNMHNKDEEISREASPGFDVLVDDEVRDSDYYPVQDQYGGAGDHERSEYDANPSADYSMAGIDQDVYREAHNDYDKLYAWEQRGVSSERKPGRSYPDRRQYGNNTNSLDHVGESDLRHRLSKPRKVNGLRSVISHEHTHHEKHVEGRSWRERNNLSSSRESSSISSRLQGRISVPFRSSSPLEVAEIRPEVDRSRDHGRLSQGRLQERMRGRLQEDPGFVVGRHGRGPLLRRDVFGEDDANFAAPKSLSELKGKKSGVERNGELSHLGKRKPHQNLDDLLQPSGGGCDLSFEGPKPLEEILKRKRRASDNKTEDHSNHQKEKATATIQPSSFHKEGIQPPPSLSSSINRNGELENNKPVDDELEVEDGMVADEEGAEYEDDVVEGYDGDQQGGEEEEEDYYEQVDGDEEEDVHLNDPVENVDPEDEEYLYEDEDADDFAKKMAVVFS